MRIVDWSDGNLQVAEGDEIKILRGKGKREGVRILATRIENVTRGTTSRSSAEGVLTTKPAHDFTPPIHGYAGSIEMHRGGASFTLEDIAPPVVGGILRECAKFIDPKLYQRCTNKDYHDVVTNAFPVLEDRIRAKISVDASYSAQKLIDHAFKSETGRLILGETSSEQNALHLLFKGAFGFLRNPPSHRLTGEESNIEAFEIVCMVDLLLRIVDKARLRS